MAILDMYSTIYIPQMPEKEMANRLVLECFAKKEFPKLTVKVGLKLEHLYQLEQVHQQHLITENS